MDLEQLKKATGGSLLLVSDATAALRWEAYWLAAGNSSRSVVAPRPAIRTPSAAIDYLLESGVATTQGRQLLSAHQCSALWRHTVMHSVQGPSLITSVSAGQAADQAWRLLHEWNVPWETLRAGHDDPDFEAVLDWCHGFANTLRRERWADRASLYRELCDSPASGSVATIGTVLCRSLPPAVERVMRPRASGQTLHTITTGRRDASARFVQAADAQSELSGAAAWLESRLANGLAGPIALVLPDAERRSAEILTVLGDVVRSSLNDEDESRQGDFWLANGRSLTSFGAAGAALNALDLVFGHGQFSALSTWLRSPYFSDADRETIGARAQLEAELRGDLVSQWRFRDALERGGLLRRVRQRLPATAERLRSAASLASASDARLAPTEWVDTWEKVLRVLGWVPTGQQTPRDAIHSWDRVLQQFASLSAVLGVMRRQEALEEFRRLARGERIRRPMPLSGVHVFERAEQIGPGYAGIWIAGFTDRNWPQPMRLNSLLPGRLQREHGMPGSTPALAHQESIAVLARLLTCTDEVIFSAPAQEDDAPVRPSRLLKLPVADLADRSGFRGYVGTRIGARRRTVLPDPVPIAAPAEIRGGMRLLELQANCPVRAFCEYRLSARPLEPLWRGIHPRLRGIVLHRALELLFGPVIGADANMQQLRERVALTARKAVGESIPWSHAPWDLIAELESARAARAIVALLDRESQRAGIQVAAVESQARLIIDGWSLTGRIDRLDRIGNGGLLIFDYKTGQANATSAWYSERLLAPQMPAYAVALHGQAAGFVVVSISDKRIDFRAAGMLPADFPVVAKPTTTSDQWDKQIDRWRGQISDLLTEFASGDVRISVASAAMAAGDFAPLTRVYTDPAAGGAEAAEAADV